MKLGGGLLLWVIITVLFFRWHRRRKRTTGRPGTGGRSSVSWTGANEIR